MFLSSHWMNNRQGYCQDDIHAVSCNNSVLLVIHREVLECTGLGNQWLIQNVNSDTKGIIKVIIMW